MFSFFKRTPKVIEKWGLVKTIYLGVSRATSSETKVNGKLYYHLLECNLGNRKIEFASTFSELDKEATVMAGKKFDIYQEKIFRWEHGRYDPEIPRYSEIPEEDTVNALKVKIE
jgi:hypothetical protein